MNFQKTNSSITMSILQFFEIFLRSKMSQEQEQEQQQELNPMYDHAASGW